MQLEGEAGDARHPEPRCRGGGERKGGGAQESSGEADEGQEGRSPSLRGGIAIIAFARPQNRSSQGDEGMQHQKKRRRGGKRREIAKGTVTFGTREEAEARASLAPGQSPVGV